jgi:hypothetical protein
VARDGDTNGPASVYAIQKYLDWIKAYAPAEAQGMTFSESGPVPAQGNIAQRIFWYTAFTADMVKPGLPVMNEDGTPKWHMAPSPHGSYWKDGMPGPRAGVADWHQRAGLSEAGAALVAGDRRCVFRCKDGAGSHGFSLRRAEKVMARIEKSGVQGDIGPKLAEEHDLQYWHDDAAKKGNLAPQLKLENEKEKPVTVNYDELVKSWQK